MGPAFAITLAGLFTCVAQRLRVTIEFDGAYGVTHVHSKYKYEPEALPSPSVTLQLHDLNADESRNLLFQLHVPKIEEDQQDSTMSQSEVRTESSIIGECISCSSNTNAAEYRRCSLMNQVACPSRIWNRTVDEH